MWGRCRAGQSGARTAKGIKVSLWEVPAPLSWRLSLAGFKGLGEGRAYTNIVPSRGGHPRGGGGRHLLGGGWGRDVVRKKGERERE